MSFRINAQQGLTSQDSLKVNTLINNVEGNPILWVTLSGNLTVRCSLNSCASLYMRGELKQKGSEPSLFLGQDISVLSVDGNSLNWQEGIKLENKGADTWSIPFRICVNKSKTVAFKFLIDDVQEEEGENHDLRDLLFLAQSDRSVNREERLLDFNTSSNNSPPQSFSRINNIYNVNVDLAGSFPQSFSRNNDLQDIFYQFYESGRFLYLYSFHCLTPFFPIFSYFSNFHTTLSGANLPQLLESNPSFSYPP